eukprot:875240-Prymnesium_polylepis.1
MSSRAIAVRVELRLQATCTNTAVVPFYLFAGSLTAVAFFLSGGEPRHEGAAVHVQFRRTIKKTPC